MTDDLLAWIQGLPPSAVHAFLVVSTMTENLFPPWPGDTLVVFAGVLVARNVISLPGAVLSTLVGNMVGAWIMYVAGERLLLLARAMHQGMPPGYGRRLLEDVVSEEGLARAHAWFARWGLWFVLVSRFSAGIRFFVSIVAGISRMNALSFSLAFAVGVLVWNLLLLSGGLALAENWRSVLDWLEVYNMVVLGALGVVVIVLVARSLRRRRARMEKMN